MKRPLIMAALSALVVGVYMKQSKARGLRNNNPLNIRVGNDWQGETPANFDGEFEQFNDPIMGIRAGALLMKNYREKYGLDTIAGIISRWAPDTENNTSAYIASVSGKTNISPDQTLSEDDYIEVIKAMITHENGAQPYTDAQIHAGFIKGFYA